MFRLISVLVCLLLLAISLGVSSALAVNRSLSLDGDGDLVRIPDDPSLDSIVSEITIEAWLKRAADQSGWKVMLTREKGTGGQDHYYFGFVDNKYIFGIHTTSGFKHMLGSQAPNGVWRYN